jgi:hypothetical protein
MKDSYAMSLVEIMAVLKRFAIESMTKDVAIIIMIIALSAGIFISNNRIIIKNIVAAEKKDFRPIALLSCLDIVLGSADISLKSMADIPKSLNVVISHPSEMAKDIFPKLSAPIYLVNSIMNINWHNLETNSPTYKYAKFFTKVCALIWRISVRFYLNV